MKPSEFTKRLAEVSQSARHHPEPAVAVAMLADLLLKFATELEPIVTRYAVLIQASGFYERLTVLAEEAQSKIDTSAAPAAATPEEPAAPAA